MTKLQLSAALLLFATSGLAQTKIWDNGPLVTDPGAGPGGSDLSVLQTAAPSPLTVYGYGAQRVANNVVGDDFVITGACTVTEIEVFTYQTGSTTTSTITGLQAAIWKSAPSNTGTPLWGDVSAAGVNLMTNGLVANTFTNIYRTTLPAATSRPVMRVRCKLVNSVGAPTPLPLTPGRYWLTYILNGSLASGPWVPPVAIKDQPLTGDGIQAVSYPTGTFAAVVSGTAPATYGQGIPFNLYGACTGSTTAAASTYGAGKAGSVGVPAWDASGLAAPGLARMTKFEIKNCVAAATPLVVLGLSPGSTVIPGIGTVLVTPFPGASLVLPAANSANISRSYLLLPPDPVLGGLGLYWQGWILDGGAVGGICHSDGLKWAVGQ